MRILVAAAMLLVMACSADHSRAGDAAFRPLEVGAAVPAYAARTLAGDTVRVGAGADSAGAPTILNVWATWCTSCREEMAALDSLRRQYAARGVRVIAVSVDDGNDERVRRFADANHLEMTVAHDPNAAIEQSFQVVGVPTTFVIDGGGKLVWRHTGNVSDVMPEAEQAVAQALGR